MYRTDFNKLYRTEQKQEKRPQGHGREEIRKTQLNRLDRTKLTIARVILGSTSHSKR